MLSLVSKSISLLTCDEHMKPLFISFSIILLRLHRLINIFLIYRLLFLVNSISIPTIELEGEYEKRYTSALNSVLGPENFYIEVKANFKQKLAVKKENDIPINFTLNF